MAETSEPRSGLLIFDANGIEVPARYRAGTGDTLVILLHGAVNREKREVPAFHPFLPALPSVHQLSISDPGMLRFGTLAATWYLGWEGRRLWEELREGVVQFAASIGCGKRIYVGGSTGGFAALLLSHGDAESVAIPCNPQTDIMSHGYGIASKAYLSLAWPEAHAAGRLAEAVPFDLKNVYGPNLENRIVYLQSAGDYYHLYTHALPFLSGLRQASARVVASVGYYGIPDHSGSIPHAVVSRWIRAVLAAEVEGEGAHWSQRVLDAQHEIAAAVPGGARKNRQASPDAQSFPVADLRLADRLAQNALNGKSQ